MTAFVVDASIAMAWCFDDEQTPESERLFDLVADIGATVPSHWRLEVGNSLRMAVRRRRVSPDYPEKALVRLSLLPIETDSLTDAHAWTETLRLATLHELTTYDAAYLELALRRQLPLATLDRRLAIAASKASDLSFPLA